MAAATSYPPHNPADDLELWEQRFADALEGLADNPLVCAYTALELAQIAQAAARDQLEQLTDRIIDAHAELALWSQYYAEAVIAVERARLR
jgi:hypothetical protein